MKLNEKKQLAQEIRQFADAFTKAPVVGARIEVVAGQGGPTTGLSISVESDPSGRSVTGMEIRVDAQEADQQRNEQVEALLAAAELLEQDSEPKLVKKMISYIGNAAAAAGMREAFENIFEALG